MGELVSDFFRYNYDAEDADLYDSDVVALATKAKAGEVPARETDDALQKLRPTAERIRPIATGLFAASGQGPQATSSDLAYVVFPVELWYEMLSCAGSEILHLDLYERVVLG
eukprot:tig00000760_g3948.t1